MSYEELGKCSGTKDRAAGAASSSSSQRLMRIWQKVMHIIPFHRD